MADPNNLNKRLNDLFSDLISDETIPPIDGEHTFGWMWECDAERRYVACGPEVEPTLGMAPDDFVGRALTTFQLVGAAQSRFQAQLEQQPTQGQVEAAYRNSQGQTVPVRIHYTRLTDDENQPTGWRGFTQLLEKVNAPAQYSLHDGLAIKDNQLSTVSTPFSSAGQQSLATRQTIAQSATPDAPASLAVPLQLQQNVGLLELIDDTPNRQWSEDEQLLVQEVAYQLSLALENAQLFETEQRRAREMSTLHDISLELAQQQLDRDAVLGIITRRAMELLDADGGGIWLWDQQAQKLELVITYQVGPTNMTGRQLAPGEGLTGQAFRERQTKVIDDYLSWSGHSETFDDAPFHAAIAAPMIWQNQALGVLTLTHSQQDKAFSASDQDLAQLLAGQAASMIRSASLFDETEQRAEELALINRVVGEVASSLDLENSLQIITTEMGKALNVQTGFALLNEAKDTLKVVSDYNPDPQFPPSIGMEIPVAGNPSSEQAIATREPVIIEDAQNDPLTESIHETMKTLGIHVLAIYPLVLQDEVLGTLGLGIQEEGRHFTPNETQLVGTIITQTVTAIENARLFDISQKALAEQRRLGRAVEATADIVIITNLNGEIMFVNSAFTAVTGYTAEEALGQNPNILKSGVQDDDFYQEMWQTITRGEPWRGELVNKRKNGELFNAQNTIAPILDTNGEITQYVAVQRDITDQKQAEQEREQLIDEVQLRALQLQTAAEVSRAASSVLEIDPLLEQTVDLIRERFNLYYAGIFLTDTDGRITGEPDRWAVLRAGTGEAGRTQLEQGHKLEIGGASMIGQCIARSEARISQLAPDEKERFVNPNLPDTQSEMALPLLSRGETIGAMTIQSEVAEAFSEEDITALQTMADQIANSIRNAQLFEETTTHSKELELINNIVSQVASSLDMRANLEFIGQALLDNLPLDYLTIGLTTPDESSLDAIISLSKRADIPEVAGNMVPLAGTPMQKSIETRSPVMIQQTQDKPLPPSMSRLIRIVGTQTLALFPLITGEECIGTVGLHITTEGRQLDDDELRLIETILSQASTSIQNARLFEQIETRRRQLVTAAEVSQAASSILDPDRLINQTVNLIRDRFELYYAGIFLVDEDGSQTGEPNRWAVLRAGTGEAGRIQLEQGHRLEIGGTSMIGQCIANSEARISLLVPDEAERFVNPILPDTLSEMALPLRSRGKVIGAMTIQSERANAFSEEDIAALQTMADQVANALQNASLFDQTNAALAETRALYEITNVASQSLQLDASLQSVLDQVLTTAGFDNGLISIYDKTADDLKMVAHQDLPEPLLSHLQAEGLGGSLCELVYTQRELISLNDLSTDAPINVESLIDMGLQSYLGVPLAVRDTILGTLCAFSTERDTPLAAIDLMRAVGQQIGVAIENANLYAETQIALGRTAALYEVSRSALSIEGLQDLLTSVTESIAERLPANRVTLITFDRNNRAINHFVEGGPGAQHVVHVQYDELEEGLSGWVLENKEVAISPKDVPDPRESPAVQKRRAETNCGAIIVTPLLHRGEILGTMTAINLPEEPNFTPEDVDLMTAMASQVAIAARNVELYAQTQQQLANISTLQETTAQLNAALTLDGVINTLLAHMTAAGRANSASLFMISGQYLVRAGTYPQHEQAATHLGERLLIAEYPLTQQVIQTEEPRALRADDPQLQEKARENFLQQGISATATIPITVPEGVIGVVTIHRNQPGQLFSQGEVDLMHTLTTQAAVAIQNARLYEEQRETAEQLRELDKLKSQFLANMSHELRTPLNSIIGFSRVIMKGIDGPVTEQQEQDLSAIYSAGQHLLNMINDILDISKIEAGKMELAFDEIDLREIFESVMSTVRGLVKDKPVKLVTTIAEDLPPVEADPTRVRQILLNLLSNAAKFTDEGAITLAANQQINANGKTEILVSVSDSGVGIAPEDQVDLFEPFTQVDGSATRKTGGTGLGLSITRLLVDLHGGDIAMESTPGSGSTFTFTLPVNKVKTLNILAADADPQVISLYQRYLSDTDYQVISVTQPEALVEMARKYPPFAITLDLVFPEHDAWELLANLKADPDTQQIPIIICSILDEREKALEMGAAGYLAKPILNDDLINALDQLREPAGSPDSPSGGQ